MISYLIHPTLQSLFHQFPFTTRQIIQSMEKNGFDYGQKIKLGFLPKTFSPYDEIPFVVDGHTRLACAIITNTLNDMCFDIPIIYENIEKAIEDAYNYQANRRQTNPISLAISALDTFAHGIEKKANQNNCSIGEANNNLSEWLANISGLGLTYSNQLIHLWRKHDCEYLWLKQNSNEIVWNKFYSCFKEFEKKGIDFNSNLCELSNWDAHRLQQVLLTNQKLPEIINLETQRIFINGEWLNISEISGDEIKELRKELHKLEKEDGFVHIPVIKKKKMKLDEILKIMSGLDKNLSYVVQLTQLKPEE